MHGWYSVQQAKLGGSLYYTTPKGGRVEVTVVSETMDHGCYWDDLAYVGEVVSAISGTRTYGELGDPMKLDTDPKGVMEASLRLLRIAEKQLREKAQGKDPKRWN
jgi:hypothetical protein